ncbi:MAG: ABC transporter ATP-binding protein [archaeon]|nr:ABC transporter ATP-binding protein [archaeon]
MVVEIRAENLAASYGEHMVWEGLDLVIDKPGLVGILGPNGVGKSTFMYMVNRLMAPVEGRICLDGRDVAEIDHRSLAKIISYVPQKSDETFSMSVLDTVLMGRYPLSGFSTSKEDVRVAARCLRYLGITDLAMRSFNELSAGQHQKVMIARGLAQEPKIMLLDEPTSNLDVYHQLHVMKMLRDIAHEKGIIIIVICHDLNVASRFADRLVMFSEGKVRCDGTPAEVITPDTIREVYRVDSDVMEVDGRPYVIYHAQEKQWSIDD